jgi:uncharacterized protein (UPF0332 family)
VSAPELSQDFADNLFEQVFTIWVKPEVIRRVEAGTLQGKVGIWGAQVLFDPPGPETVRLNDEINGEFRVRSGAAENVTVTHLNLHTIAGDVETFHLPLEDSPNAGHITVMLHQNGFFIAFELLYNAERITEHLIAAREYLDTARHALESRKVRPAVSNLYATVELLAKATLLRHPNPKLLSAKSHRYVAAEYNLYSYQGNADNKFAQLLNALADAQNPARYPSGQFNVTEDQAEVWLRDAEEMYAWLLSASPIRTRLKVPYRGA